MKQVPLCRRLDMHRKLGVPRGYPDNIIRQVNVYRIKEMMDRDT
jgi:hypothetical protein